MPNIYVTINDTTPARKILLRHYNPQKTRIIYGKHNFLIEHLPQVLVDAMILHGANISKAKARSYHVMAKYNIFGVRGATSFTSKGKNGEDLILIRFSRRSKNEANDDLLRIIEALEKNHIAYTSCKWESITGDVE